MDNTPKQKGSTKESNHTPENNRADNVHADNTERLAAIGKMTSKIAHELNNPLDGILRYINLSIRALEQNNIDKPKEYLAQCRHGLMRMVKIVRELLEFSRSTYVSIDNIPIEQIIEDAIKTMHTRADSQNVQIIRKYEKELPNIRNNNLFQVFCNLTKNALDAMPDGGKLIITARMENNQIHVELQDTGDGLPPGKEEHIFEPFFTTKEKDKGTGLGLAICRDIVEHCHGRIFARNSADKGSIFTVILPVDIDV